MRNSVVSACLRPVHEGQKTPTSVDFTFPINGNTVTVTSKLQCWETQTVSGSTATQTFAFGKDDDYYYLVYRTFDSCTTSGCGKRFLLAKATVDGNKADIWMVGSSKQTANSTTDDSMNVQRILANKSTGAFTFNHVKDPLFNAGIGFASFYGNTDGTKVYMEGVGAVGSNYNAAVGFGYNNGWCASVSALTTSTPGTCGDVDRTVTPDGFGLSFPMVILEDASLSTNFSEVDWAADSNAKTAFLTALDAIGNKDLTAAGVTKWTSGD